MNVEDMIPDGKDDELKQLIREQNGTAKPQNPATNKQHSARQQLLIELYDARRKQGLTQVDLAAKAGVPQSTLARIEAGRVNPTLKTLLSVTEVLGVQLTLKPKR